MSVTRARPTVAIAADLLDAIDNVIQLAASRRKAIDAAFDGMADDSAYRREALGIAAEFEIADGESLGLGATGS